MKKSLERHRTRGSLAEGRTLSYCEAFLAELLSQGPILDTSADSLYGVSCAGFEPGTLGSAVQCSPPPLIPPPEAKFPQTNTDGL